MVKSGSSENAHSVPNSGITSRYQEEPYLIGRYKQIAHWAITDQYLKTKEENFWKVCITFFWFHASKQRKYLLTFNLRNAVSEKVVHSMSLASFPPYIHGNEWILMGVSPNHYHMRRKRDYVTRLKLYATELFWTQVTAITFFINAACARRSPSTWTADRCIKYCSSHLRSL